MVREVHLVYDGEELVGLASVDVDRMVRFHPLDVPSTPLTNFDVVGSCVARLASIDRPRTQPLYPDAD